MMRLEFDKGTLIFKTSPAEMLPEVERMFTWDDRIAGYRALACSYRDTVYGLKESNQKFEDAVFTQHQVSGAWRKFDLRPYQRASLINWHANGFQGIVCLPTGAGKTRVAIAACAWLKVPALILVPTCALVDQWLADFSGLFSGIVGQIGDGKRVIKPITVSTFESAYRHMHWLGNKFKLLIVDEAHHFGCGRRDEVLQMSAAPYRLGLTATAPTDDVQLTKLSTVIGKVVFSASMQELAGKYLASFEIIRMQVQLNANERLRYDREREIFNKYYVAFKNFQKGSDWRDWVNIASQSVDGRAAMTAFFCARRIVHHAEAKLEALKELLRKNRGQKMLIFTGDADLAIQVARRFLVPVIAATIGKKERQHILALFGSGRITAVVSCRVLNEGLNVPDASIAVIMGGTSMEREYIQRIGRLLRPSGSKKAVIFEMVVKDTFDEKHASKRSSGFRDFKSVATC